MNGPNQNNTSDGEEGREARSIVHIYMDVCYAAINSRTSPIGAPVRRLLSAARPAEARTLARIALSRKLGHEVCQS
jgi:hypothetical protein